MVRLTNVLTLTAIRVNGPLRLTEWATTLTLTNMVNKLAWTVNHLSRGPHLTGLLDLP